MSRQDFANVKIDLDYDIGKIVELTGLEEPGQVFLSSDNLYVQNASQQQLHQAVAKYKEIHNTLTTRKAKENALMVIERYASESRKLVITDSFGQDTVYREKYEEAIRLLSHDNPEPRYYPFLRREADAIKIPIEQLAKTVLDMRSMWIKYGSMIEQTRMKHRNDIKNSEHVEQINSIKSQAYIEFRSLKQQIENDVEHTLDA